MNWNSDSLILMTMMNKLQKTVLAPSLFTFSEVLTYAVELY